MKRQKMSRGQSGRNFRNGAKVKKMNVPRVMRGGWRL